MAYSGGGFYIYELSTDQKTAVATWRERGGVLTIERLLRLISKPFVPHNQAGRVVFHSSYLNHNCTRITVSVRMENKVPIEALELRGADWALLKHSPVFEIL